MAGELLVFDPLQNVVSLAAADASLVDVEAAGGAVQGAGIPPGTVLTKYTPGGAGGPSVTLSAPITTSLATTTLTFDRVNKVLALAGPNPKVGFRNDTAQIRTFSDSIQNLSINEYRKFTILFTSAEISAKRCELSLSDKY